MSMESQSSLSSSSTSRSWTYDVFLSFRGEDTRKNFTDHLYAALVQAGIHTFRDHNELPRGEEISSQILKAIEESKISIAIFSKSYASSDWCLDELAKMMECKHTAGQIVLPVFYNIKPSDVRKQKRSFTEAFEMYEEYFQHEMEKVNKWRTALKEAANLSGFDLNDMADGHESKFIQKIIEDVLSKLDLKIVNVAKHLVGIDSRVDKIFSLLNIGRSDVRTVGIHGMGGIGKTTIAKVVFNKLEYGFEGSCFLLDVREISAQPNGLVRLQEQLLIDVLKSNFLKISNVDRGIILIKERLCRKRVLVVLDNVDRLEQLDALAREQRWFGPGSRIIITTRDERLLTQIGVDGKYHAKELFQEESLHLFSWHAFRDSQPQKDYIELSNSVVAYAGGVPLALEVLGSHLFKRSISAWRSAIEKLEKIPYHQIQSKLRISFDTLDDDKVKGIFLDIACFFIGWDKDYVAKILEGRGFFPNIGISLLIERSLIAINHRNQFKMHDLLRDMGREIIREMSPNHLGKRSRIWLLEDAWDVLNKRIGTEAVEGLVLDARASKSVPLSTKSLTEMTYLKLLVINGVCLTGCYNHLSKELIWLCWHECPLESLPSEFQLDNLVILEMQYSKIKELWKDTKFLNKLKILDLSYSKYLSKIPNFLGLFSLERLVLEDCTSLVAIHQSIGHLKRIVFLNLKGCKRLKNLPQTVSDLKTLATLDITMCSRLETLPESLGSMESLTELLADGTAIQQLPSSIGQLKNLRKLSLCGFNYKQNQASASWLSIFSSWLSPRSPNSKALLPPSFHCLSLLRELDLSYRGLPEVATYIDFGNLSSLQKLNLSGSNFFNLPFGIGSLPKLEELSVMDCKNLLSISGIPLSLGVLNACNCTSLERLSIQKQTIPVLLLNGCQKLVQVQGMECLNNSLPIFLVGCDSLANNFRKSVVQALCKGEHYDVWLPDCEIPGWFDYHGDGSSLSLHVPVVSDGKLQAMIVWAACTANERYVGYPLASAVIKRGRLIIQLFRRSSVLPFGKTSTNYSWVNHIPFTGIIPLAMEGGGELEPSVGVATNDWVVEKRGVRLIIKRPDARDSRGAVKQYSPPYVDELLDKTEMQRLHIYERYVTSRNDLWKR